MEHIFVVDDEKDIRELIKKYLVADGYKVTLFSDGNTVYDEIFRLQPSMIVLDVTMPGIDGLELCKNIRKTYDLPIIFVSARGDEIDRIVGIEIGADDYLAKPFSPRELMVRIKSIFRRLEKNNANDSKSSEISILNTNISTEKRMLTVSGSEVRLTSKEFDTIAYLITNLNIPLSREQILETVWGFDYFGESRVVDDVIKRIRKKLKESGSQTEIQTVWGVGYKIEG